MATIKNKLTQLLLSASLLFLIAACSPKPEFELYEGKELSIAVLGTKPEVEEEQVDFQEITFDEFTTEELNKFDAVFIMKENLEEAAESQYAPIYSDTHIPFFFIENNKDAYPFIDADLAYEDAREIPDHNYYATSFLKTPYDEERTVRYGLYNDEVSEENIREAFSRMFKTVEQSSGD